MLLGDPGTEGRQGVLDGAHDGGRGDDEPALADAPEVHVGIGEHRVDVVDLDPWDDRARRQQVVHERARQDLPSSSYAACLQQEPAPIPWATPPRTWPSTIAGLTATPQSSTTM